MIYLYGIPNCDTVKKARQWLSGNHIDYEFVDFKKNAPTAEQLNEWLAQIPLDTLLNKRGTTWRKLEVAAQAQAADTAGAINLMCTHTSLIKRPILVKDGRFYAGFSADSYAEIFAA
ncbi:Spx/MgsR family RNA polymerase-binding regulatory protein [Neisseria perflava]|uniref:Spx/MgsR family RNA polymerase-binding regulatory protein n=1 Tax=Neisseria perflava TaxID=33053 RepID=UPI00209F9CE8|nr:Spx/MgsR family RNA polymerase-binding regulatory protein [Neisseria perflava]MCP1660431.1 Spx/MgsR family transcriptional regulator [Neisseria perflava]MCP1772113.1 Spx/MgsR family transcriptional regulator [Neisseria perflava]